MRATLVKKADGWYNLYHNNIGIGSTHEELQGFKLSRQNCDEIFGVTDVKKLAEECFKLASPRVERHADYIFGHKDGFNKAMELNKDKLFTEDDLKMAIELARETARRDEFLHSENTIIRKIRGLAIEIQVEIELLAENEECVKEQGDPPMRFIIQHNQAFDGPVPKRDANDCLILKKLKKEKL